MRHDILKVAKQMFFAEVTECTLSNTVSIRVNLPTRQAALAWQAELEKHAHRTALGTEVRRGMHLV